MQELMVLSGNPRRRRRKHKARKSRRRHRKMTAKQLKYFGPRHAVNPKRRRRRARRHAAVMGFARRARRSGGRALGILSGSTGSLGRPMSMIGPALTGAIGAVAVNAVSARLPLPAMLTSGRVRYVTQGALAIGLGMLASRFGLGAGVAAKMAEGSLTVTLHQALVEIAAGAGVNLSGMGYYLPGRSASMPSASAAPTPRALAGMGKYVTGPGTNVSVLPSRRASMGNINSFKF